MSPWDAKSFKKHNKKLTNVQAKKAAAIANAVLEKTGDEGLAVKTANSQIKRGKKKNG